MTPLRTVRVLCGALLLLTASAGLAAAQEVDLEGVWTMRMLGKSPTGEKEADLVFERDGYNLTVTMSSPGGEVESAGYVDGNEIRFYYIREGRRGQFVAKFTGHVRGDLMGGEVDMGKEGTTTWMARRGSEKKVDLDGTWTLQISGEPAGGALNLSKMTFRQDDHRVVVTLDTAEGETDCDGFIEDDVLTFYCVQTGDEGSVISRFTGQLGGAVIGGELDMGEHGKTTWMATQDV